MHSHIVVEASYLHLIEEDKGGFSGIAFSEDCLAIGRMNAKINIYSIDRKGTTRLALTILGHSNPVFNMVIQNQLLFTGESIEDALIKVWEARTGHLVRALKGHTLPINCLAAHSSQLIASASSDRSVRVWQL